VAARFFDKPKAGELNFGSSFVLPKKDTFGF